MNDYCLSFKRLIDYLSNRCANQFTIKMELDIDTHIDIDLSNNVHSKTQSTTKRKQVVSQFTALLPLSGNMSTNQPNNNKRYEWAALQLSSTFNPHKVFRIAIHWLVASSPRIESEVKGLNRRCSQFGLKIQQFPEYSINADLYLHALIAPPVIVLDIVGSAAYLESVLLNRSSNANNNSSTTTTNYGFVDDGYRSTSYSNLPNTTQLTIPTLSFTRRSKYSPKREPARQLIHVSGDFFIRILIDSAGVGVVFYLENSGGGGKGNAATFRGLEGVVRKVVGEYEEMVGREKLELEEREKEEELRKERIEEEEGEASRIEKEVDEEGNDSLGGEGDDAAPELDVAKGNLM